MRKMFNTILKVIAGFLFCAVSKVAFIRMPQIYEKLVILIGCSVLAIVVLSGGLALTSFRNWRRDVGGHSYSLCVGISGVYHLDDRMPLYGQ